MEIESVRVEESARTRERWGGKERESERDARNIEEGRNIEEHGKGWLKEDEGWSGDSARSRQGSKSETITHQQMYRSSFRVVSRMLFGYSKTAALCNAFF